MTSIQPELYAERLPSVRSSVVSRVRPHGPLLVLLAGSALLYIWGLGKVGYGNDYYAAAVKAGTQSWKAFLYGSLDSSSFITVDKPPASLWVMELSGRVFGFSTWSMLLPQALMGIASVGIVYAMVKRWFGRHAGLLAGGILALTPVAALMFRFNNPDALLVLASVVAACATMRAVEKGQVAWLALAGTSVGLGFLTKMLEALLIVPALGLAYLLAAPVSLGRRAWHLGVGVAAMVVAGGWWVALVELTPASARPYVGGSTNNSLLDLIWGYNGVGRLDGSGTGQGANFSGSPGLGRLFNSELGGEISWLLPTTLVALAVGVWLTWRRPRTDRLRAALVLFGAWLLVAGLVFSYMSGVIHPYYSNLLAPPIAIVLAIVASELWSRRTELAATVALAVMVIVSSVWGYVLLYRTSSWQPWLRVTVLAVGAFAAVAFVAIGDRTSRARLAVLAAALTFAALGASGGYTLATVANAQGGANVSSGPATAGRSGGFRGGTQTTSSALTELIASSSSSYRWAAATGSSMTAAPLELATGTAVMALGGFNGSDKAITLAAFEKLVATRKIHYFIASEGGFGGGPGGGNGTSSEISSWVASHYTATTIGGSTVYDLTK